LSHTFPKKNAAIALLECLESDQRFQGVPKLGDKLETLAAVVLSAFEFEDAAVCVDNVDDIAEISKGSRLLLRKVKTLSEGQKEGRYFVPLTAKYSNKVNAEFVREHIVASEGIIFFRNGKQIGLSSGQRLFAYVVINILGAIRRNSLIVVDEPELFLHPTLEIQFVSMLKTVLTRFNSKAVLATHSVVTVREVPEDCVHVFQADENKELHIVKPPFQTFGGDHQRISSYVFGDNSVSKPFEAWIDEKLQELGSADALLEALAGKLNEEITIDILAKAKDLD
jgi:energy-coupling factor transporter ATP-binding protein EcfA2